MTNVLRLFKERLNVDACGTKTHKCVFFPKSVLLYLFAPSVQAAPNAVSEGPRTDNYEVVNWSSSNKMLLNESKKVDACYGKTIAEEDGKFLPSVTLKVLG